MPFFGSSSFLQVPFLNLMSSVAQRSGQVNIRVGGNTQDYATLVSSLPDGVMIQKEQTGNTDPVSLVQAPRSYKGTDMQSVRRQKHRLWISLRKFSTC